MLPLIHRRVRFLALASLIVHAAASAHAQSDPANFGTVYNIGTVPVGSMFDVPGAVTGTEVGDGDANLRNAGLLTPTFLGGDILGPNSQLNLFGDGEILQRFYTGRFGDTGANIEINVLGGSVGRSLFVSTSSVLNIVDGSVSDELVAESESTVNLLGGGIGEGFKALPGSSVNIFGGSIGRQFQALSGSKINIVGGSIDALFILESGLPANISGASIGNGFVVRDGTTVNISDTSVGRSFRADNNGTVNILSGVIGDFLKADSGSTVNIFGGVIGNGFDAESDSKVKISGGSFGDRFSVWSDSSVDISGGSFGDSFRANSGSTLNLAGPSFFIDGEELTGLVRGEAFEITDRDITLSGIFTDGTPFSFELNSAVITGQDFFDRGAILTVTLAVPEPSTTIMLVLVSLIGGCVRRQ